MIATRTRFLFKRRCIFNDVRIVTLAALTCALERARTAAIRKSARFSFYIHFHFMTTSSLVEYDFIILSEIDSAGAIF
jgi:hypothetical protein